MSGPHEDGREVMLAAGDLPLAAALEAILLVVDEPVTETVLAQVLEHPVADVAATLADLSQEWTRQRRGMDLRRVGGGWRLYSREEYAPWVERFVLDGQQARLTQAALETLAVVAYRQPVSRARVSAIRGVGVDGVMRTLQVRGLIEDAGTDPEGGAHLYRTSRLFLEKLGLDSLDELPSLAPLLPDLADVLEADPGLRLTPDPGRGPVAEDLPADPDPLADPDPDLAVDLSDGRPTERHVDA